MGSANSRIEASPPVRRRKRLRIASFLCGAGASDGDAAAGSTAQIETQVHESQDRNQVATNFTKSSIKELENSHSERATTSNSSNFQTGDLQSDEISEHTPIQEHSDTTVINTEFEATSSDTSETNNNSNINNNNNSNGNGRRSIWEAISRPGSRRNNESSEGDEVAFYDRWLDLGDEIFGDTIGDELRFSRRRRRASSSLNWHSRSLIRERNRVGSSDRRRNNSNNNTSPFCPSGLHPDGTCACSVFSSAEASISRIVMLTEALFEYIQVLDEIHRHPTSLSLSSTLHQAPESVVNSLPSKSHKKSDKTRSNDEVEQCYICLTEYEDGEQIRVLPCNHEFHMSCVDKWLKEVHRVCPLCRGDVCENTSEILSSN